MFYNKREKQKNNWGKLGISGMRHHVMTVKISRRTVLLLMDDKVTRLPHWTNTLRHHVLSRVWILALRIIIGFLLSCHNYGTTERRALIVSLWTDAIILTLWWIMASNIGHNMIPNPVWIFARLWLLLVCGCLRLINRVEPQPSSFLSFAYTFNIRSISIHRTFNAISAYCRLLEMLAYKRFNRALLYKCSPNIVSVYIFK